MKGIVTRSKRVRKDIGTHKGKPRTEAVIRTFLWDNPEIRKAYKQAADKNKKR